MEIITVFLNCGTMFKKMTSGLLHNRGGSSKDDGLVPTEISA